MAGSQRHIAGARDVVAHPTPVVGIELGLDPPARLLGRLVAPFEGAERRVEEHVLQRPALERGPRNLHLRPEPAVPAVPRPVQAEPGEPAIREEAMVTVLEAL